MTPKGQGINLEQVKAEISLFEAKLGLNQRLLEASDAKDLAERRFITEVFRVVKASAGETAIVSHELVEYTVALQKMHECQRDILLVQIDELKSAIGVRQFFLEEAQKSIVVPKGSVT